MPKVILIKSQQRPIDLQAVILQWSNIVSKMIGGQPVVYNHNTTTLECGTDPVASVSTSPDLSTITFTGHDKYPIGMVGAAFSMACDFIYTIEIVTGSVVIHTFVQMENKYAKAGRAVEKFMSYKIERDGAVLVHERQDASNLDASQAFIAVVIYALETAHRAGIRECQVHVANEYIISAVKTYIPKWMAKGWVKNDGGPVKNIEYLAKLYETVGMFTRIEWKCDKEETISSNAMNSLDGRIDVNDFPRM
jgi:ribonuclease HI